MSLDLRMKFSMDTSAVQRGLSDISSAIKSAAGLWAVQKGADAVRAVLDYAGSLKDLSEQTGFSTDALQKWNYAATMTGLSAEKMQGAMQKFQDMMGGDELTKGQSEAMQRLGLDFDTIKAMKPEEAFRTVAQAVAAIEDPMQRMNIAMELFGKQGGKVAAVAAGFDELAKSAPIASAAAINAAAEFGDKMDAAKITALAWGANVVKAIQDVAAAAGAMSAGDFQLDFIGEEQRKQDAGAALQREQDAAAAAAAAFANADKKKADEAKKSSDKWKADQKEIGAIAKSSGEEMADSISAVLKAEEERAQKVKQLLEEEAAAKQQVIDANQRMQDAAEAEATDKQRKALQDAADAADQRVEQAKKAVDEVGGIAAAMGLGEGGFADGLRRMREKPGDRRRREREEKLDDSIREKVAKGEKLNSRERARYAHFLAQEMVANRRLRAAQDKALGAAGALKKFDAAEDAKAKQKTLDDIKADMGRAADSLQILQQRLRVRD